jgi:hypothetical protein
MSVTRALVELKRTAERIQQTLSGSQFAAVTVGLDQNRKVQGSNKTVAETEASIRGSFDKMDSLIANRQKLKAAIVKSNALTTVTILGKTISVAEAIELKSTLDSRRSYLQYVRQHAMIARSTVEHGNQVLEDGIEKLLTTAYGSDRAKIDPSIAESIAKPQRQQKQLAMLDPVDIDAKIVKLQDEISQIESEIDFVLSESNARTEIEVDF